MKTIYPSIRQAEEVQNKILKVSGGLSGFKDKGALDSILTHIQNDDYYPDFEDKITHLFFQVAKGHCFNDGNKRTAIVWSLKMILDNNYIADGYIDFMENIVIFVVENKISKELLKEIMISIINDDYQEKEWLKIEILKAIQ